MLGDGVGVGGMDRGPVLQFHVFLPTPSEPLLDGPAQRGAGALCLPPPGLSSRSTGSVGMDGCPGPAEFTACTRNTYLFPGCKSEIWGWEWGREARVSTEDSKDHPSPNPGHQGAGNRASVEPREGTGCPGGGDG